MSNSTSFITGVLVSKTVSVANAWTAVGTVPTSGQFGVIGFNVVNTDVNSPASFNLALSSSTTPSTQDTIESNITLSPGGILERTQIIANAGETLFIQASSSTLVTRLYGVTQLSWGQLPNQFIQQIQSGAFDYAPDTSDVANTITVSYNPNPIIQNGTKLSFMCANSNTGPAIIDVNGTNYPLLSVGSGLTQGSLIAGNIYEIIYQSGSFVIMGGLISTTQITQSINSINQGINSLNSSVSTISSNLNTTNTTLNNFIEEVNAGVNLANVNTEISTISSNLNTTNLDLANFIASVNSASGSDSAATNAVTINTVSSNLNTTNANVATNASNISTINSEISNINSEISTLNSDIVSIENEQSTHASSISSNAANISNLITGLNNTNESLTNGTLNPVFDNVTVNGSAIFTNYSEVTHTINDSGTTLTINLDNGSVQVITLTANCTIALTGAAPTGFTSSITLYLEQGSSGSAVVTWPTNIYWGYGNIPTLSTAAGAIDVITLTTFNNGTTWFGFLSGKGMAT